MTELTIIKISATGRTSPDIAFGTPILLIQDGVVSVGKIMCDPDNRIAVYIDHPKNEAELNVRADKIVREQRPEYLKSEIALTVSCPLEIADCMIW